MKRRAVIIYMTNSPSGKLNGPANDNLNYRSFLMDNLGGNWYDHEIVSLENPTIQDVKNAIARIHGCDYSLVIFTGHGAFEEASKKQHMEVMDGDIKITDIKTDAEKQTIIIDSCRGYFTEFKKSLRESTNFSLEDLLSTYSTREKYELAISQAEKGLTVLYAASENESALDTDDGAAYLLSLIEVAERWEDESEDEVLDLREAHNAAIVYLKEHFEETIQRPALNQEKRSIYFPFAVK